MNVNKNCLFCNKAFNVSKNDIQKYCSVECVKKSRIRKQIKCATCDKLTTNKKYCGLQCIPRSDKNRICTICKNPYIAKRKRQIMCSKECGKIHFHNMRINLKGRRSKFEILLYEYLVNKYPELNIISNDRTTFNGLEIDIWIPELKLAIEWNGPFHYIPIRGESFLKSQQDRDKKKIYLADDLNIHLIVIPADKQINKTKFKEITDGIVSIIDDIRLRQHKIDLK